jgi:hypothetical protein
MLAMNYDYGRDYQEAQRIFGKDIFQIAANIPEGDSKAAKRARAIYYKEHPALSGYTEWRKQFRELPTSINELPMINWAAANQPAEPNASMLPGTQGAPIPGQIKPVVGDAADYAALYKGSGKGGGRGGRRGGKRSSRRGGGGGGGYGGRGAYVQPIDPRQMSGNLWTDTNFMYKWKPTNIDLSWLEAGKRIGPDSIKPWKPIKV